MSDELMTSNEQTLQADLQRWAEAGAPTLDLGAALERRSRQQRSRWRRWGSVAATLVLLSTAVTVTFPAWAASAADWPLIGEPIKAYLAERAGLSWAYEMGFYKANLAELSEGGITVRVLGVLADPLQTKVFYQIQGYNPHVQPAVKPGDGRPRFPVELQIEGIDGVGGVSSYYSISGFNTTDSYNIAETTPITGEAATLNLKLRVGESVKSVDVPVSRAASSRFFKQVAVEQTQTHGPVSITLQQLTLSPAEVVASYKTLLPPGPDGSTTRGPLPQPYLRAAGRELPGRSTAAFSLNYEEHRAFPRIKGDAQLVIPTVASPVEIRAQWPWAPGSVVDVQGVPVTLAALRPSVQGIWVDWTYPADSPLLGLGGYTLIGKDGTRLPLKHPGSGGGTEESVAHSDVSIEELPPGFEPAAIEVSHAIWRIDGPWVFDLPTLPAKP